MSQKALRGFFIVIEGADGTGKSTQVQKLVKLLCDKGFPCEGMRFPDRSTQIGKMIDGYLTCQQELSDECIHLLFSANRWELKKKILSTLSSGTSIVCDRYAFSGVAYTSAKPGFNLEWCMGADKNLPKPDLVFYLEASTELRNSRGDFGMERYERDSFQSTVNSRFKDLMKMDPSICWEEYRVEKGIDGVTRDLFNIIDNRLAQPREAQVDGLWADLE